MQRPGRDAPLVRRRMPAQHADPASVAREVGTRLWGAERSGASRFTGPERAEFYRYAVRQAATVADHLRHCTATDPDQGADPAWAVADALHTAAKATGSRTLGCAADTYDRASRSPHGRVPRHTPEGNRLRAAARLLAMTGGTTGDGMGLAGALAGNLVALIDAVAGLRQAQAHAAQAAAALHGGGSRPGLSCGRRRRGPAAGAMRSMTSRAGVAAGAAEDHDRGSVPGLGTIGSRSVRRGRILA